MSEYVVDDQGAGLDDGGEYTGSEGDYSGLGGYEDDAGYEDSGQGAGVEPGFGESLVDEFSDVEQALAAGIEMGLVDPSRLAEFVRAEAAAAVAPIAQDVQAWQETVAAEQAEDQILDALERHGVEEGKLAEARAGAAALYPQLAQEYAEQVERDLRAAGVTDADLAYLTREQFELMQRDVHDRAALDALELTARRMKGEDVVASKDDYFAKGGSVVGLLDRAALAERGGPRSPGEAVAAYRKGESVIGRLFDPRRGEFDPVVG
jgi:hypothetical protein